MKIQHKTLLMASAVVMLCGTLGIEKAHGLGIDIEEGQTYENNQNGAVFSGLGQGYDVYAGVNINRSGDLQIKNNTFTNNSSSGKAVMGFIPGGGGAIYDWGGTLNVTNSIFNNNSSTATGFSTGGGALMLYNTKAFTLNGSQFNTNTAAQSGGAIYFSGAAQGLINNSKFIGNTAGVGGGALYLDNKTNDVFISDSVFSKNIAGGKDTPNTYGGAIALNGMSVSATLENDYTITHTTFEENQSYDGGALFVSGSGLKFNDLTFNKNEAHSGGAVSLLSNGNLGRGITFDNSCFNENIAEERGGAIYASGEFKVNNGEFIKNSASQGGAIFIAGDTPNIIEDTTFKDNHADYLGGAIDVMEGTLQINDSRFENNYAGTRGGALSFSVTQNNTSEASPTKSLFIYNTDFINNECGQASGGAIYVNVNPSSSIKGFKTVRIESNDGTTHEFTGNIHNTEEWGTPEANAIYINQGNVELGTKNEGSKLLFNDGISGTSADVASVEVDGDVIMNAQVKNVAFSLNGGQLTLNSGTAQSSLKEGMPIFNNADLTLKSGVLNMQNGKFDTLNLRNLTIDADGDAKIAFDADLSTGQSDIFNVTQRLTGGLKFDAEHFDVKLTDGDNDKFQLFNGAVSGLSFIGDAVVQYTNDTKYTLTVGEDGFINVDKDTSRGLADAVEAEGVREFRLNPASDLTISKDLGAMNGEYLKINLDSQDLNGAGKAGITVAEGQRLELMNMGSTVNGKSMHDFSTEQNGAVVDNAGELTVNNSVFKNNFAAENGGVINNTGTVNIKDSTFINNKADNEGGAIYNEGGKVTITAESKDVLFSGNKVLAENVTRDADADKPVYLANDITMVNKDGQTAELTVNGSRTTTFEGGIKGEGLITKDGIGNMNLGGNNSEFTGDVVFNGGTTSLMAGAQYFSAENTHFNNNAMLNLANNSAGDSVNFGNLHMDGNGRLGLDVDMSTGKNDTFAANTVTGDGKLLIDKINIMPGKNANTTDMSFNIIDANGADKSPLIDVIQLNPNTATEAYGPIFKYGANYDPATGQMMLSGGPGKTSNNYNPAVLAAPVGALVGAYLTQLNSYEMAFNNMDMYMLMPEKYRNVLKFRNKYAITEPGKYYPPQNPHEERGAWVKPYSTFESVRLNRGPRVSNVAYGTFFGADSDLFELKNGFDGMLSVYGSYNGSHQAYKGNGIWQNGGTLGATGVVYKGNFFSALTANAGASVAEANTMYGSENFTMFMSGVASKTGYNWELGEGKFIIQPSYQMSYSFINTFDYHNAAGVDINADPLHALQISPGLKFIGNLKNGWQPYLGLSIIWNLMDDTRFKANDVTLPELSVDPYFLYGFGVQKTAGERCTGFFQTMFRSGGRNGVGFQLGFRVTI